MKPNLARASGSVHVDDKLNFVLRAPSVEYRFHVDPTNKSLIHDHFGQPACAAEDQNYAEFYNSGNRSSQRFEFPDLGRGDYRLPAIHIQHCGQGGHTVSRFEYQDHRIIRGKPKLSGLPATCGSDDDVTTLIVRMEDKLASVEVVLNYSVFSTVNAIARSFTLTNNGQDKVVIESAASFSIDFLPTAGGWDMMYLHGDWARETHPVRKRVTAGRQGLQSLIGSSSHYFNPFVSLLPSTTTEQAGEAYGFSLIYSGSFSIDIDNFSPGLSRVLLGLNSLQLSYKLEPGETFQSPEACAVYEGVSGVGGMSRSFHNLFRYNLSRSTHTLKTRPVLINHWEATAFDYDQDKLYSIAQQGADLGCSLFVMDDGWFGSKYTRVKPEGGLGDWIPNPKRFPKGLGSFVRSINSLRVGKDKQETMRFGIWVEGEMVSPRSELYEAHPEWALHAGAHERTEERNQLVLNLASTEVQDYIINIMSDLLKSWPIQYVKWDKNRAIHEMPHPSMAHRYMIGLYRVMDTLTTQFPDILWEGCAGGGGRFDPGILCYWPQSWTSDNTDGFDRLSIQFGTSIVYPASSMGCHVSACPSRWVGRTTPLMYRAHVAMMGGAFGFELDLSELSQEDQNQIPVIIDLAKRLNPLVITGDMYRLGLPSDSDFPAVQYLDPSTGDSVVLAFQTKTSRNVRPPRLRLMGLDSSSEYLVQQEGTSETDRWTGSALLGMGLDMEWSEDGGDYQSEVVWVRLSGVASLQHLE